jgi:hypothetical protein
VINAKSNGNKSQLSVQDVGGFFSGMYTNSLLTTMIIVTLYFAAEIAEADGLEHIMDSNRIPITQVQV